MRCHNLWGLLSASQDNIFYNLQVKHMRKSIENIVYDEVSLILECTKSSQKIKYAAITNQLTRNIHCWDMFAMLHCFTIAIIQHLKQKYANISAEYKAYI